GEVHHGAGAPHRGRKSVGVLESAHNVRLGAGGRRRGASNQGANLHSARHQRGTEGTPEKAARAGYEPGLGAAEGRHAGDRVALAERNYDEARLYGAGAAASRAPCTTRVRCSTVARSPSMNVTWGS